MNLMFFGRSGILVAKPDEAESGYNRESRLFLSSSHPPEDSKMKDVPSSGNRSSCRLRDRRLFLKAGAAIAASAALSSQRRYLRAEDGSPKSSANSTVVLGFMGVNNRGAALASGFAALPNVEIASICDVDSRAAEKLVAKLKKGTQHQPSIVTDVRKLLDDKAIDAIVVAAPNHWHAPATILGCSAGKHVYVEKPCSHTPQEGEWAIEAARKHDRVVTMGSQRRSWPAIQEAIEKIQSGVIGDVLYARTWYNNRRTSIGSHQPSTPPAWLHWDLWQGPAPRTEYRENILHYHWHWFWKWGNGELGNNGIHAIDVARWGLGVEFPLRVSAGGGKYRHQDDQETPDTMMATFDFPGNKTITWEGLSWSPLGPDHSRFGLSFHGTEGSIVIRDPGYTLFDMMDKEVSTQVGRGGDADHLSDFVDAIRNSRRPNADIAEAHRSTLLCHLGNIAYRTQTTLTVDSTNGHIKNLSDAENYWTKDYDRDWEPKF
jgi:predicted dehydrogenase